MARSLWSGLFVVALLPIHLSCQVDPNAPGFPPGATGDVDLGEPTQIVPLYVTTTLSLWEECLCSLVVTVGTGTGTSSCSIPPAWSKPLINLGLDAPKGTDGLVSVGCLQHLVFQMDDDTALVMPRSREGTLVLEITHGGLANEAINYQISVVAELGDEAGTQEIRQILFCEGGECGSPYAPANERVEFKRLFEAGRLYFVSITVDSSLGSSSSVPNMGGEIIFELDVAVHIEF